MNASVCSSNNSCPTTNESMIAFGAEQMIFPGEMLEGNATSERIPTTEGILNAAHTTLMRNATDNDPTTPILTTNVTTDGSWNITEVLLTLAVVTFEERIIESVATALIVIIGIPANLLLAMTLAYNKRFRKPLHRMLFCISVCDFFTVVLSILTPYTYVKNEWVFGKLMCDASALVQASCISSTLMTHALVAINCYLKSRFRSTVASTLSGPRAVCISLFFILVSIGLLVFVPHLTGYIHADYAPVLGMCVTAWTADTLQNIETYIYIHFTVCSIFPYTVCIFSYSKVLYIIWKRQDLFENNIMKRQFVKACKRMGVLFIAFSICYLPFTIFTLADPYLITIPTWGIRALLIIFMSHAVVNPLICLVSMSDINKGLRNMLSGAPRDKTDSVNSSTYRNTIEKQKHTSTSKSVTKMTYSYSNSSLPSTDKVSGADPSVTSWM